MEILRIRLEKSRETSSHETEELQEKRVQPLIKTEKHTSPQGRKASAIVCAAPGMHPELSELETKFLSRLGETETKAQLSDDETRRCWEPGMF